MTDTTPDPVNVVTLDPWEALRRHTDASIALGRAGASLPTAHVLRFSYAHASARDAVHIPFDREALRAGLSGLGLMNVPVSSRAETRQTYLARPDLGRRLTAEDAARLAALGSAPCDVAIVVADGLSSTAIAANAVPFIADLLPLLKTEGLSVGPVAVVENGRVAIGDEIGAALKARLVLVLIGERPGLSSVDSLGAYLTYGPKPGLSDADRNCISNIREAGLKLPLAAAKAFWLIREALKRKLTGVDLKEEQQAALPGS
ncbi:ethanolamine ammonia-lyase subunit EutC [Rhizobiaceae bacterium BDR2-2]|uniref:Ethanolamine ammonia-lyase small subunit n=1 Tax=Ectorhizobium quercum TaxID=2965071 RepID=A0AAE3SYB1_9HYPH|nr:ethanolamine ammonia-lyase subunit EutC [Ectorhizobium quercum]MCX8999355.1 ethanolamine ammonia-lyase subunit EutC [Ectorhizobium quercum]